MNENNGNVRIQLSMKDFLAQFQKIKSPSVQKETTKFIYVKFNIY